MPLALAITRRRATPVSASNRKRRHPQDPGARRLSDDRLFLEHLGHRPHDVHADVALGPMSLFSVVCATAEHTTPSHDTEFWTGSKPADAGVQIAQSNVTRRKQDPCSASPCSTPQQVEWPSKTRCQPTSVLADCVQIVFADTGHRAFLDLSVSGRVCVWCKRRRFATVHIPSAAFPNTLLSLLAVRLAAKMIRGVLFACCHTLKMWNAASTHRIPVTASVGPMCWSILWQTFVSRVHLLCAVGLCLAMFLSQLVCVCRCWRTQSILRWAPRQTPQSLSCANPFPDPTMGGRLDRRLEVEMRLVPSGLLERHRFDDGLRWKSWCPDKFGQVFHVFVVTLASTTMILCILVTLYVCTEFSKEPEEHRKRERERESRTTWTDISATPIAKCIYTPWLGRILASGVVQPNSKTLGLLVAVLVAPPRFLLPSCFFCFVVIRCSVFDAAMLRDISLSAQLVLTKVFDTAIHSSVSAILVSKEISTHYDAVLNALLIWSTLRLIWTNTKDSITRACERVQSSSDIFKWWSSSMKMTLDCIDMWDFRRGQK